jgi:hypothetical protein
LGRGAIRAWSQLLHWRERGDGRANGIGCDVSAKARLSRR